MTAVNTGYSASKEAYVWFLRTSWLNLLGAFAASTAALSVGMAVLYAVGFDGLTGDGRAGVDDSYADVLLYAVTVTLNSPSPYSPRTVYATACAAVHSLLSQLLFLFFTGCVFARLSRPSRSIRLSHVAVLSSFRDEPTLMVRLVVSRSPPELFDVRFSMTAKMTMPDGFTRLIDLVLVKDYMAVLRHGFYVRHVVDAHSPLFMLTREDVERRNVSVRMTVLGLDPVSYQTVVVTREYFARRHDILVEHEYVDMLRNEPDGTRVFDHSLLHHTRLQVKAGSGAPDLERVVSMKSAEADGGGDSDGGDGDGGAPPSRTPSPPLLSRRLPSMRELEDDATPSGSDSEPEEPPGAAHDSRMRARTRRPPSPSLVHGGVQI